MKFRGYPYYIVAYILGTVVTLVNALFLRSTLVFRVALVVLYSILLYKNIHILLRYEKTGGRYKAEDRRSFGKTYRLFRIRVALFWLAFIGLCGLAKFVAHLDKVYFYGCTFFFLFLDRWFVNGICLLQKFSDPKGRTVLCCCSCPCRGWDLMMIHTPLLFALSPQGGLENGLILLSSTLAVFSLVQWETHKYQLVETRPKCAKSCDLKLCREHRSTKGLALKRKGKML